MHYTFTDFWAALQKCRQLNTDYNGGFFSLDAAVELYWHVRLADSVEDALAELDVSEDPNTAIWVETGFEDISEHACDEGYDSVSKYIASFTESYKVGPNRWLLRCE